MFYIIAKDDERNTFTVLDTEDMSTDTVSKKDALEYFRITGIEYRVMLNSTLVSYGDYSLLYIKTESEIKGVLLMSGKYSKAVGFQKECTDVKLEVGKDLTLFFTMSMFGVELISCSKYMKDLTLIEEGKWERG